jgi:hypothetical protein
MVAFTLLESSSSAGSEDATMVRAFFWCVKNTRRTFETFSFVGWNTSDQDRQISRRLSVNRN